MVSIARKHLLEDIPRFLVAQAGIMFAVSLVTIQTGIFNGFTRSTAQLMTNSSADIWVASENLVHLELTLPIPLTNLSLSRQVVGVESAEALIVKTGVWRNNNEISLARIIGFDPNGQLFIPQNVTQGNITKLKDPYTAIVDASNLKSLNLNKIGDRAELSTLSIQLVGLTTGNRSIISNPYIFTSLENANAYANSGQTTNLSCRLPSDSEDLKCTNSYIKADPNAIAPKRLTSADTITFVLIRAQKGQDLAALKRRLIAALPNTSAYTHAELMQRTQAFWQQRTGIGFILALGAVVGVIVGGIIVGQILYASVSDRLKEFGTLKAMGASDFTIYSVILEQALWMAILGYLPSMALCWGVSAWTLASQGILILITPTIAIAVLGITVVMCVGSGVFAIQKVMHLDPASVFKA
ncbi:FtsX-like permease family protein [Chlorogloea sp. CCALA 695]|uniref:FtsX-like permease family protein n=1 Tax=Chlorogloea sp. CCALA 695 TaxID=2107693 RepID=UPI000D056EE4|nr:FtsX-like permease family protein [Chlorogloea sp. CCALA 695]PSB29705.1 ABC transporter permease [Chlorogloea sp. CCALA 695]